MTHRTDLDAAARPHVWLGSGGGGGGGGGSGSGSGRSQYFSNSLVTCAIVLPLVSGSLFHVNQPKNMVRPTKMR